MTQPTREEALAHFGVKGMRWGVRNASSNTSPSEPKKRMSTKKKAAIGISVLAVGTAATVAVLAKNGNIPIKDISMRLPSRQRLISRNQSWAEMILDKQAFVRDNPNATTIRATDRGAKTVKRLSETSKFKKLMKEFDSDIAEAHREQTAWMLRNVPTYNPRTDPYVPSYELERLRTG